MTESNKTETQLRSVRFKVKIKTSRGVEDAESIVQALRDDWSQLGDELNQLPSMEQDKIKSHFNGLIDGFDELGEILFGDLDDFNDTVSGMNTDQLKAYIEEIVRVELIDLN